MKNIKALNLKIMKDYERHQDLKLVVYVLFILYPAYGMFDRNGNNFR